MFNKEENEKLLHVYAKRKAFPLQQVVNPQTGTLELELPD